jgi:hypothetical protein
MRQQSYRSHRAGKNSRNTSTGASSGSQSAPQTLECVARYGDGERCDHYGKNAEGAMSSSGSGLGKVHQSPAGIPIEEFDGITTTLRMK